MIIFISHLWETYHAAMSKNFLKIFYLTLNTSLNKPPVLHRHILMYCLWSILQSGGSCLHSGGSWRAGFPPSCVNQISSQSLTSQVSSIWPSLSDEWSVQISIDSRIYNKALKSCTNTMNNEYIERIHQMSYSSLSDNKMLQIFSFLIKWLYGTL